MLARVKEFVGDVDKLLVEYQQDIDADIDIDIEAGQLGKVNQELQSCDEVPRRVLRRISLRESLRACVYSSVSTRRARMLCQSSGKSVEDRQPRQPRPGIGRSNHRTEKKSPSTRSESVAIGWMSGEMVCASERDSRDHIAEDNDTKHNKVFV